MQLRRARKQNRKYLEIMRSMLKSPKFKDYKAVSCCKFSGCSWGINLDVS